MRESDEVRERYATIDTPNPGPQRIWRFPNGLGASVIPEMNWLDGPPYVEVADLWELAVIHSDGRIAWDIEATIHRWLTEDEVEALLKWIETI